MPGPSDWGAVALQEQPSGPEAWGAQPAEQPSASPANPSAAVPWYEPWNLPEDPHGLGLGQAIAYLPIQAYRGLRDAFMVPGDVAAGKQLSPDDETDWAAGMALNMIGGSEIPRATMKAIAPTMRDFQDTVTAPALQRIAADARPAPTTPAGVMAQPEVRDAIINGPVNRDNHVPYEAGATAGSDVTNVDKSIPEVAKWKGQTWETAPGLKIHEQVEDFVAKKLIAGGMENGSAYSVSHWEFAEPAEDAYYVSQGLDPNIVEDFYKNQALRIQKEPDTDLPDGLAKYPYPHDSLSLAREGGSSVPQPTAEQVAQAQQILGKTGSEMTAGLADFFKARDLGVIGPERPRLTDGTPAEAAARSIPAARPGDETLRGPEPGGKPPGDPWEARFEQFVGKLTAPNDAKDLIRAAARENGNFMPARLGEIPLQQLEDVETAVGVAPGTLDRRGLGRLLKNDNEVRLAMQGMMQATENVKAIARDVKADSSPENLIKLQQAIARRDMAVEGIVGLRAEWGRTGNVFQEFMENVKDEKALSDWLRGRGQSMDDLRDLADALDMSDRDTAAKVLEKYKRTPPGWLYYTWVNGLISGILTHTKYGASNALYLGSERGLITPMAAMIGKAKELAGVDTDRVFFGETVSALYGMTAATPGALLTAGKSVLYGERFALRSEQMLRDALKKRNERVPSGLERRVTELQPLRPTNDLFGAIPADSVVGRIVARTIGVPGDAANGIHFAFKTLNERAALESLAYRKAAGEGLSPTDPRFWSRRAELAADPTEDMLTQSVHDAYKGTFMQELGPWAKQASGLAAKIPGMRWLFPFWHIPVNLLKATYEYTPAALASLGIPESEIGAALRGARGGAEQDKAIARMVVGSAVMGYFVHLAMNGQATGDAPMNAHDRQLFYMAGKQPNSILSGDQWISYQRFGPAGDLAALGANFAPAIAAMGSGDHDSMLKATGHALVAAVKLLADEVGFFTLQGIFNLVTEPDRYGPQFLASEASSLLPFSSALGQSAAYGDPDMRQAKTLLDGIKYRLPGEREALLPKRDWNGRPIQNPQFHSILRNGPATPNPVDAELVRLNYAPAPVQGRIGPVHLTPAQQDEYAATAGPLVDRLLTARMNDPGYRALGPAQQKAEMQKLVRLGRSQARMAMQAHHPEFVLQGNMAREQAILGR